jgi:hypothetical protein
VALYAAAGARGDFVQPGTGLIGEQEQFSLGVVEFGETAVE